MIFSLVKATFDPPLLLCSLLGKTKTIPIKCNIETIDGLSGHSDFKQLINYLTRLKQRPERVIVNHGEASKCIDLARNVHKILRCETSAPKLLETLRLK